MNTMTTEMIDIRATANPKVRYTNSERFEIQPIESVGQVATVRVTRGVKSVAEVKSAFVKVLGSAFSRHFWTNVRNTQTAATMVVTEVNGLPAFARIDENARRYLAEQAKSRGLTLQAVYQEWVDAAQEIEGLGITEDFLAHAASLSAPPARHIANDQERPF